MKNVPSNLSYLKSKVDKLDVDKSVPVPVDLSKLIDVVKEDVVKKNEYDELVKNVNAIQTTGISDFVKNLATTQKLMKLKRKLLIMIMVNITTQEFNKLTTNTFAARLKQENLASKNGISVFVKSYRF